MRQLNIIDAPDQQFSFVAGNRRLTMRVYFNPTTERWDFDLAIDDLPVVYGRRIVTGLDLLEPFELGIGMLIALPFVEGAVPDRTQLPDGSVRLYSLTREEYEAARGPIPS